MSNKTKNQPDAPLEKINEGETKFLLSFLDLDTISFSCHQLKDFPHMPLSDGKKLHRNYKTCDTLMKSIREEGDLIEKRRADIKKMRSEVKNEDEAIEVDNLMKDLIAETLEFNKKTHEVYLYTMPSTDFPDDRAKFGKKTIPDQLKGEREVDYINFYLELLGNVIIDCDL